MPHNPAEPKTKFTWLHLSDWHQGRPDLDREQLLKKLLSDIKARSSLDARLRSVDAVFFSGDVAFSGKKQEYEDAENDLIKPLKKLLGSETELVFCPGNHDFDRSAISEIPEEWRNKFYALGLERSKEVHHLYSNAKSRMAALGPFKEYRQFCKRQNADHNDETLIYTKIFNHNKTIGVASINTAIACNHFSMNCRNGSPSREYWDYGALCITEQQMEEAIASVSECDVRILLMHHPLSWLDEAEQAAMEARIVDSFDLVFHGHEHLPRYTSIDSNLGEIKYLPAGSAFAERNPQNPRYTNAYNFGTLDLTQMSGTVFHRRWSEENFRWVSDNRYWIGGQNNFVVRGKENFNSDNRKFLFNIQRNYASDLGRRPAHDAKIALRHERIFIADTEYVEATVSIEYGVYPGDYEEYDFFTSTNRRISRVKDEEVAERAFKVITMHPEPAAQDRLPDSPEKLVGRASIDTGDTKIIYKFSMLECTDGVWQFVLRRFVDKLEFIFIGADGLTYEYLPLGGFPATGTERDFELDPILRNKVIRIDGGLCPHQGFQVQWYPSVD